MIRLLALAPLLALPWLSGCAGGGNAAVNAVKNNDILQLRAALDAGQDFTTPVYAWNLNILEFAACKGNDKAVLELLSRGADVNMGHEVSISKRFKGVRYTPLTRAIACNGSTTHPSTVRLLLDHGAKVDPISLAMASENYNDNSITEMVREAYELQSAGKSAAKPAAVAAAPRRQPGNLDDAAYDRLRAAANLPPEKKDVSSDVDSPKSRGAQRPDDFALVVGIEEYQSLPKADYGARDANAVRRHLEALGVPARNIIALVGPQATGSKLKSYLEEWLPLNVKPESTLFVYYSGHGAPDPKTGDAYLVPWDGDPKFLKSTALPLKTFYADLAATKAKKIVVALDACFSGAGGRSVLAAGARPLVAKVADVAADGKITVLAAASGDEITGTLAEQGHGLFTYHLLKGLMADSKASAASLFGYLKPRVEDDARRENRGQTPVMKSATPDAPLLP